MTAEQAMVAARASRDELFTMLGAAYLALKFPGSIGGDEAKAIADKSEAVCKRMRDEIAAEVAAQSPGAMRVRTIRIIAPLIGKPVVLIDGKEISGVRAVGFRAQLEGVPIVSLDIGADNVQVDTEIGPLDAQQERTIQDLGKDDATEFIPTHTLHLGDGESMPLMVITAARAAREHPLSDIRLHRGYFRQGTGDRMYIGDDLARTSVISLDRLEKSPEAIAAICGAPSHRINLPGGRVDAAWLIDYEPGTGYAMMIWPDGSIAAVRLDRVAALDAPAPAG